jgi:hypothetical protein
MPAHEASNGGTAALIGRQRPRSTCVETPIDGRLRLVSDPDINSLSSAACNMASTADIMRHSHLRYQRWDQEAPVEA